MSFCFRGEGAAGMRLPVSRQAPFALLFPIAGLAAGGSAFVVNRRRSLKGVS